MKNRSPKKNRSPLLLTTLALAGAAHTSAFAVSETHPIVDRKKNGSYEVRNAVIDDLIAPGSFETPRFKIVWKKEDEALTLDRINAIVEERKTVEKDNPLWVDRDADHIRMMASTALFHSEKAYHFWTEDLGAEEVRKFEQIVIRLDITNQFSEYGHFANDNYATKYNNAVSIEGGKPRFPDSGIKPWGREIWFRPRKEIPISEILAQLPENPANSQIREARKALYPMQIDLGVRNALFAVFNSELDSPKFVDDMTRQAGTLLLLEGAFQVLKVVNRFLIPQRFYLDTAFVPEIIYHEFSHLAMSDIIKPDVSTPVNEGMADFFAATIVDHPKLAKKIREYSTATGKNGKKKQFFQMEFESLDKARADFVLGLLWSLRKVFGDDRAVRLVFEARKDLTTRDSNIRDGLVSALLKACDSVCESPLRDRMLIHQHLQNWGI